MNKQQTVTAQVEPFNHGSYFAAHGTQLNEAVKSFQQDWLSQVPLAQEFAENKARRDGNEFHVTVVTPPEVRKLRRQNVSLDVLNGDYTLNLLGVGVAYQEDAQAWFVVVHSPKLQEVRNKLGLPFKDLHATLGFAPNDVYLVDKSVNTLAL